MMLPHSVTNKQMYTQHQIEPYALWLRSPNFDYFASESTKTESTRISLHKQGEVPKSWIDANMTRIMLR